jgi:hypothetical protein
MALAENHRAALKLEATAGAFPPTGCRCYEHLFSPSPTLRRVSLIFEVRSGAPHSAPHDLACRC